MKIELGKPRLVSDEWMEVSIGNDWIACFHLFEDDGYISVDEIRVVSVNSEKPLWEPPPSGGITALIIRAIRIGDCQQIVHEFIHRQRNETLD